MTDPIKDAWNDVADSFTALGRTMKERFDRGPEPAPTEERGTDPTAALREAFEQLLAAGRDLGDKIGGIARDEALRTQARQVGSTINQALEATVDQLGGEMRAFFKGSSESSAPVDSTATDDEPLVSEADPSSEGGESDPDHPNDAAERTDPTRPA